jgi:hypothetical protein
MPSDAWRRTLSGLSEGCPISANLARTGVLGNID